MQYIGTHTIHVDTHNKETYVSDIVKDLFATI